MDSEKQQPLLSSGDTCRNDYTNLKQLPLTLNGDVEIKGVGDFCREFYVEFKRLWYLAGPVIFTSLCQYTIGATTQLFAGQLGTIQLAATSVENSIIAGFSYSILYGMGGALETLCGQAYGRGNIEMLGIYLQRAWILLNTAAAVLIFTYIFGVSILHLLGQTATIATAAGSFAIRMIPQLFAYATVIPIIKFLQAQSIILPMALIAVVAAVTHVVLSWLFMMKLGWGLTGAAMVLDGSWWFITLAHFAYVLMGWCGPAWSGFSWKAFNNLTGFLHVSFTSAVMFCLGTWYTMSLVLFAGYFENPEISVDALSVCFNILGWVGTVSTGLNVAVRFAPNLDQTIIYTSDRFQTNVRVCRITIRGERVVITCKNSITHNIQSSSVMSSTIIPSLATFFSGNGHHSQHPTRNPHTPSHTIITECPSRMNFITQSNYHALICLSGGGLFVSRVEEVYHVQEKEPPRVP